MVVESLDRGLLRTRFTVSAALPPTSADEPRLISTRCSSDEGRRPTIAWTPRRTLPWTFSPSTIISTESRTIPRERSAVEPSALGGLASTPGSLPITSPMVRTPMFSMSWRLMMIFCVAVCLRSAISSSLDEVTITSPSVISSVAHAGASSCKESAGRVVSLRSPEVKASRKSECTDNLVYSYQNQ